MSRVFVTVEIFDDQFAYHDEFSLSSHVGFMLRHSLTETAARKDFSSGNSRIMSWAQRPDSDQPHRKCHKPLIEDVLEWQHDLARSSQ